MRCCMGSGKVLHCLQGLHLGQGGCLVLLLDRRANERDVHQQAGREFIAVRAGFCAMSAVRSPIVSEFTTQEPEARYGAVSLAARSYACATTQ